jgi:diguanylate cyclase (GGDEF)-like protein
MKKADRSQAADTLQPPHRKPSQGRRNDGVDERQLQPPKAPARAAAMQLAAEVERLAAELEASRTRIAELESKIDTDPLTETLNRRGFERQLKRALDYIKRYGVRAALVYIDLDEFKPVNDRHGHAAGDAVLKAIAASLIRQVRASDVIARIGGDEFVALLWNVDDMAAAAKAAALEAAVYATPVRWDASTLVVGASAGMTMIAPLDKPTDAIARADAAMYIRKAARRRFLTPGPSDGATDAGTS